MGAKLVQLNIENETNSIKPILLAYSNDLDTTNSGFELENEVEIVRTTLLIIVNVKSSRALHNCRLIPFIVIVPCNFVS